LAIGIETARHIARLAHLEFSDEEILRLSLQLNEILGYIEKLDRLELRSVEPTSHVTAAGQVFREDRVAPSLTVAEALANAPESREGQFTVPKVIG
jgi:aspartyl-tRNA(Asn)/glutamyl-tRNA(Gln) amidotransferase subunit C